MHATPSMGYVHPDYLVGAQFFRRVASDLVSARVVECPCCLLWVEPDPDRPACPHQSHRETPIVQRDTSPTTHQAWHQVRADQLPDLADVPRGGLSCCLVFPP